MFMTLSPVRFNRIVEFLYPVFKKKNRPFVSGRFRCWLPEGLAYPRGQASDQLRPSDHRLHSSCVPDSIVNTSGTPCPLPHRHRTEGVVLVISPKISFVQCLR